MGIIGIATDAAYIQSFKKDEYYSYYLFITPRALRS